MASHLQLPVPLGPVVSCITTVGEERWTAYHLYYPADRNRVLLDFVAPLVLRLLEDRRIASFFFIRYVHGAPHIRLRLRLVDEDLDALDVIVAEHGTRFFQRWPLKEAVTEHAGKPEARREPIDQPEFLQERLFKAPVELEIERYGGALLYPHSLDFFAISSSVVLHYVKQWGYVPWPRQMTAIMRCLVRQAFGFASSTEELLYLLNYFSGWHDAMSPIVTKANAVFEGRPDQFCAFFTTEVMRLLTKGEACATGDELVGITEDLVQGARFLSILVGTDDAPARQTVGISQMHMTANRLGLKNPEESYVTQILWRAGRAVVQSGGSLWRRLDEVLRERRSVGDLLEERRDRALATLRQTIAFRQ